MILLLFIFVLLYIIYDNNYKMIGSGDNSTNDNTKKNLTYKISNIKIIK